MGSRSNRIILYLIFAGIVLGGFLGSLTPEFAVQLKFIGNLFLNALFMMVVPLIMASMIVGISNLGDIRNLGKIGGRTIIYYMVTTGMAVIVGIILVNIIQPGKRVTHKAEIHESVTYSINGNEIRLLDGRLHRTNYNGRYRIFLLDQEGVKGQIDEEAYITPTELMVVKWVDRNNKRIQPDPHGRGVKIMLAEKDFSFLDVLLGLIPRNLFKAIVETDVLPLIVFSLFFGGVLTTIGEKGRRVIQVFEGINEAVLKMIRIIMYFAPVGIFALVAARLGEAQLELEGGIFAELARVSRYALTVVVGLTVHGFVVLPLLLKFAGRQQVLSYAGNMLPALTTAFSTASSSATLPLTMECVEEKNKVSKRSASFVLPLGATINMDGTALYESVAAIFIAQVYGIHLGFSEQIIIFLTATLAAIGAAGIPEAGLVTMVIVLKAVNLPVDGIAIILAIDWLLDRFRTTVNVWGDSVGASVIEYYEKRDEEGKRKKEKVKKGRVVYGIRYKV